MPMPTPSIISFNPFRCRMWSLHDRIADHIDEASCKDEIESFQKHGQLIPALGRLLHGDHDYDVELVYGARRLFVARYLNKPIQIEIRDMTDREAVIAMDIENRHRSDVSPYERGVGYARWLKAGHFKNQDDIARTLKISAAQVSRMLKLARLPAVVIDAFGGPNHICEGWGLDIVDSLDDPQKRAATVRAAREACSTQPRPAAREVYQAMLSASARGRRVPNRSHDEVVKDRDGQPLFRIRHQTQHIALLLPRNKLSAATIAAIREFIAEVLHDETSQVPHSQEKTRSAGRQTGLPQIVATRSPEVIVHPRELERVPVRA